MKRLLSIIFIVACSFTHAQEFDPGQFDYSKVDSVMSDPDIKFSSIDRLSEFINSTFTTDHERLRAIFKWVTHNIKYSDDLKQATPDKVYKSKKAVYQGYSELFKTLCDKSGISCRVVAGVARNDIAALNSKSGGAGHAWNIVILNDKQYLIDATWAAGYYDKATRKFTRVFENGYFLAFPEIFVRQHFPKASEDQLLESPVSKNVFMERPLYLSGAITNEINTFSPDTLAIKTKYRFGFPFAFSTSKKIESIVIGISKKKDETPVKFYSIDFEQKGELVEFYHDFDLRGSYYATIFVNRQASVVYKLTVK